MSEHAIVDTHLHIWDTQRLRYPWLAGSEILDRTFAIEDYQAATQGLPVTRLIFLQCDCDPSQRKQEIAYVKEAAAKDSRIQGIVPFAPLEEGESVHGELEELAADSQIKGVRRILQGESDPAYCLRPDFVRGVQILGEVGLHFEICIYHPQMESAIELVRRCPGVRFILDHIGKPNIRDGVLSPWTEQIQELAKLPNIWCKVSGMVTEADHPAWKVEDLRPYAEHVFDAFGFNRVLYGGDWPVVTLASTYTRWVKTLEELVSDCSRSEKEKLFSSNALAFYSLTSSLTS